MLPLPKKLLFGESSNIKFVVLGVGGSEFLLELGVTLTQKNNQCLTNISQF